MGTGASGVPTCPYVPSRAAPLVPWDPQTDSLHNPMGGNGPDPVLGIPGTGLCPFAPTLMHQGGHGGMGGPWLLVGYGSHGGKGLAELSWSLWELNSLMLVPLQAQRGSDGPKTMVSPIALPS